MKKIIDGKRYDTATATLLGEDSGGGGPSDFNYFDEALYRTAKGAYFLAGEGGALTKYALRCGDNSRTFGEGLFPLTAGEAREWAEQHLTTEEVEEHFGGAIEDA